MVANDRLKDKSSDIAGQVFHGFFLPGMDAGAAINLKPGMPPGFQQAYKIGSDFPFGEKPGKDLGSEYFLQMFKLNSRGDFI